MPNRIIKESICTSETIDSLSPEVEVYFYRIIVNCDDFGRMDARPQILRAKCFPWRVDKIKIDEIENWNNILIKAQLIALYENDGKRFLQVVTWEDHQQVRASKSKFPGLNDEGSNLISIDINGNQSPSNVPVIDIRNRNRDTNTATKIKFADHVYMTKNEFDSLVEKLGLERAREKIEDLNLWKGSKGKKTASDYLTILNWERREKKQTKNSSPSGSLGLDRYQKRGGG